MIRDLLDRVGAALAALLLTILFYEGVPVIRNIQLIGHVPVLGWIIEGEVGRRLEGYADLSELAAAKARAAKEEHDRLAAQQSLEEERMRHAAAETAKDQAHADLENRIAADAAANGSDGGCSWTSDDDQWVRHH
jgi:hypothetical protein